MSLEKCQSTYLNQLSSKSTVGQDFKTLPLLFKESLYVVIWTRLPNVFPASDFLISLCGFLEDQLNRARSLFIQNFVANTFSVKIAYNRANFQFLKANYKILNPLQIRGNHGIIQGIEKQVVYFLIFKHIAAFENYFEICILN